MVNQIVFIKPHVDALGSLESCVGVFIVERGSMSEFTYTSTITANEHNGTLMPGYQVTRNLWNRY